MLSENVVQVNVLKYARRFVMNSFLLPTNEAVFISNSKALLIKIFCNEEGYCYKYVFPSCQNPKHPTSDRRSVGKHAASWNVNLCQIPVVYYVNWTSGAKLSKKVKGQQIISSTWRMMCVKLSSAPPRKFGLFFNNVTSNNTRAIDQ